MEAGLSLAGVAQPACVVVDGPSPVEEGPDVVGVCGVCMCVFGRVLVVDNASMMICYCMRSEMKNN